MMDIDKLRNKIFTFDKKLATSGDLTKINDGSLKLATVIKNLKCVRGINEEFLPTFKFFQFKKSFIKDSSEDAD